ncbi:protein tolkin-like [Glandiceps talaboti]
MFIIFHGEGRQVFSNITERRMEKFYYYFTYQTEKEFRQCGSRFLAHQGYCIGPLDTLQLCDSDLRKVADYHNDSTLFTLPDRIFHEVLVTDVCPMVFGNDAEPLAIKSEATTTFLRNALPKARTECGVDSFGDYMYTIGLQRQTSQEEFRWADSSPLIYSNWDTPQTGIYFQGDMECFALSHRSDLAWSQINCIESNGISNDDSILAFLCQRDMNECFYNNVCSHECVNTPGNYHCLCPPSYVNDPLDLAKCLSVCSQQIYGKIVGNAPSKQADGYCLSYFDNTTSWDDANDFCNYYGGNLASTSILKTLSFIDLIPELFMDLPFWVTFDEPLLFNANGNESGQCYSMTANDVVTVNDCESYMTFICQIGYAHSQGAVSEIANLTNPFGILQSMNFPSIFPPGNSYNWSIHAREFNYIRLEIWNLNLRTLVSSQPSCHDKLAVYDGETDDYQLLLGEFCGFVNTPITMSLGLIHWILAVEENESGKIVMA